MRRFSWIVASLMLALVLAGWTPASGKTDAGKGKAASQSQKDKSEDKAAKGKTKDKAEQGKAKGKTKAKEAKDKAAKAGSKSSLTGYWAMLAGGANATDPQKQQISEALAERKSRKSQMNAKIAELRQQAKEAEGEKKDALNKQLWQLYSERRQLDTDFDKSIRQILEPEQVAGWEKTQLYHGMMSSLKQKVDLTESQEQQIQALCAEYGKKAAELDPDQKKELDNQVRKPLKQEIIDEVLDDQQAHKYVGKGKKK